jgi:hypothetical protein
VVEEDVECDAVTAVVGRGKGAEATAERGRAVVGEDLDEEGEAVGSGAWSEPEWEVGMSEVAGW